jgi:hypothetical protein
MGLLSQYYKTQFIRTHGNPKLSLALNNLKKYRRWRGLVVEHPRISLLPNNPNHKHGNGGHSIAVGHGSTRLHGPPRLDGGICIPVLSSNVRKFKPLLD